MRGTEDCLGISPAPWTREITSINDRNGECVANACTWNVRAVADAKIMVAAPELHEANRIALRASFDCRLCPYKRKCTGLTKCYIKQKIRAALSKAAGKEIGK